MTNSLKLVILFLIISFSCSGPTKEQKEALDAKAQLEKDLNMYKDVWSRFFDGDTAIISNKYFTEDVVVVTSEGNLVGVEAVKNFYLNYFTGFSEIEFTIVGDEISGRLHGDTGYKQKLLSLIDVLKKFILFLSFIFSINVELLPYK